MATALALPLETDTGAPLPGRGLIVFVTFAVVLFTVVGQGLTLPALARRLGVAAADDEEEREEVAARAGKIEDEGYEDRSLAHERVLRSAYTAERQAVVALRNSGQISNDVMHRLERELDLEESHLESATGGVRRAVTTGEPRTSP